jgi:small subunit ribosomal protein S1
VLLKTLLLIVFIDLGGVDGLIHITDLSWSRINPSEVLELDQKN